MTTINMQTMRYINLLDKVSRVKTTKCFDYNNSIVFAVPSKLVGQALGPNAGNLRYIQEQIGKRVKIVRQPDGVQDAKDFIEEIVSPVGFKGVEIIDGEIVLNAGSQSKAALIGRNRRRYEELNQIVKDVFNLGLKII